MTPGMTFALIVTGASVLGILILKGRLPHQVDDDWTPPADEDVPAADPMDEEMRDAGIMGRIRAKEAVTERRPPPTIPNESYAPHENGERENWEQAAATPADAADAAPLPPAAEWAEPPHPVADGPSPSPDEPRFLHVPAQDPVPPPEFQVPVFHVPVFQEPEVPAPLPAEYAVPAPPEFQRRPRRKLDPNPEPEYEPSPIDEVPAAAAAPQAPSTTLKSIPYVDPYLADPLPASPTPFVPPPSPGRDQAHIRNAFADPYLADEPAPTSAPPPATPPAQAPATARDPYVDSYSADTPAQPTIDPYLADVTAAAPAPESAWAPPTPAASPAIDPYLVDTPSPAPPPPVSHHPSTPAFDPYLADDPTPAPAAQPTKPASPSPDPYLADSAPAPAAPDPYLADAPAAPAAPDPYLADAPLTQSAPDPYLADAPVTPAARTEAASPPAATTPEARAPVPTPAPTPTLAPGTAAPTPAAAKAPAPSRAKAKKPAPLRQFNGVVRGDSSRHADGRERRYIMVRKKEAKGFPWREGTRVPVDLEVNGKTYSAGVRSTRSQPVVYIAADLRGPTGEGITLAAVLEGAGVQKRQQVTIEATGTHLRLIPGPPPPPEAQKPPRRRKPPRGTGP